MRRRLPNQPPTDLAFHVTILTDQSLGCNALSVAPIRFRSMDTVEGFAVSPRS